MTTPRYNNNDEGEQFRSSFHSSGGQQQRRLRRKKFPPLQNSHGSTHTGEGVMTTPTTSSMPSSPATAAPTSPIWSPSCHDDAAANLNNDSDLHLRLTPPLHQKIKSTLQIKLHRYRIQLSQLSNQQKVLFCFILIVWKFIQTWIILQCVLWLGGSDGDKGRGMPQRLELERQKLTLEIGLSQVPESRLQQQLENRGDLPATVGKGEGEATLTTRNATRILYMLTVTCRDNSRDDDATIAMDNMLSTLSNNIHTMLAYGYYQVDVYWILGCTWSDYSHPSSTADTDKNNTAFITNSSVGTDNNHVDNHNNDDQSSLLVASSEYWKSYIGQQLPIGVGLEIWEDAMPLDYSYSMSVLSQSQQRRRLERGEGGEVQSRAAAAAAAAAAVVVPVKETANMQQKHPQDGQSSPLSDVQFNKDVTKGETEEEDRNHINKASVLLAPSIEKFMKQHRYVVRDKLEYYDVFLSFGASLQQQQQYSSANNKSEMDKSAGGERNIVNNNDTSFSTKEDAAAPLSSSRSLERITGGHVDTYLTISYELNELKKGLIPGLLSVDTFPNAAAANSTHHFHVDSLPCCKHIMAKNDSVELIVGGAMNRKDWQMLKVITNSNDGNKKDEESSSTIATEWVAVKSNNVKSDSTFYRDGWILTKDQLISLDYGVNRGKFLPPFTNNDNGDNNKNNNAIIDNNIDIRTHHHLLASPLFESKENGGFDLHRAISLDPKRLSKQLVHRGSITSNDQATTNESIRVRDLLDQLFNNAKERTD